MLFGSNSLKNCQTRPIGFGSIPRTESLQKPTTGRRLKSLSDQLMTGKFPSIPRLPNDPPLDLIVCIDEARNFQKKPSSGCKWDLLMQLNRAARLLPKGSVFIFMDTLSDLNVMYPERAFPSDRTIYMGLKTFVYTDLLTWDLGRKCKSERAARTFSSRPKRRPWPCMADLCGQPW